MHTFRYNPVFRQWVMLGASLSQTVEIRPSDLEKNGKVGDFQVATHPKNPFLIDPAELRKPVGSLDRLYKDHPPLGEYEVLLYEGKQDFWKWQSKHFDAWFALIQRRIIQAHHNPYAHHLSLVFSSQLLDSLQPYQRVGEFIVTSHPIQQVPELDRDIAVKLIENESLYVLHQDGFGTLYAPSAPTEECELWYVPQDGSHFELAGKSERLACARIIQKAMHGLHEEFPRTHFCIQINTPLASKERDSIWWIRIFKQPVAEKALPVQTPPEAFIRRLALSGHFKLRTR